MSRRKVKKWQPKPGRQAQRTERSDQVVAIDADQMDKRERYFEIVLMATLLAFGVYQSILYFGHTVVPISDFPDIVKVGHDLLSFKLPVRFKQAPVVGLLQALLSYTVGGQHPDLTAGWLLNAILHPLNLVLFYLVAKRIVGRAAVWFAIIAPLNHWVIYMLTEPIMETTLLFFALLTFYLIFSRSKWCYVAASVTTMVRYEGAALIVAAFVMDMIHYKSKQERIRAFLYSALATIPLALWMLGTIINWQSEGGHYLDVLFSKEYSKAFAEPVENRTGILRHISLLWSVGFRPLLSAGGDSAAALAKLTKSAAVLTFLFGSIYGMLKRQWKILTLLIFFVPYFLLHAVYPYPLQRFHTTIFWIAVLICLFGMQSIWGLANGRGRIPGSLVLTLQVLAAAAAIIWFVRLIPDLSVLAKISPKSASLPWLAMMLVGLISAGRAYICGRRCLVRQFSILAVMCLVIVSNQFTVAPLLGDGQREKEFKQLADWYIANAKPGEKLGVYMASVVQIFAPKYAEYIVRLPQADSPSKFVNACYEQNITYIVWATREGMTTEHTGYRQIGLHKNIAHLREPKNIGPYQFVAQVGWEGGYVNIFRLLKPADTEVQKPLGG